MQQQERLEMYVDGWTKYVKTPLKKKRSKKEFLIRAINQTSLPTNKHSQ